jgi:polyferredoxin
LSKIHRIRIVTAALVALAVVLGTFGAIHYGGLCSLDAWIVSVTDPWGPLLRALDLWRVSITFTCPLGFLERSLASRALLPQWPAMLFILITVLLLGRIFCAWVCPTVLLRRVFKSNGGLHVKRKDAPGGTNWTSYSSYAVLGGVLLTSFWFKFPVFCFFCPIGLFFGSAYAAIRFFSPDKPGLELLLFPVMLGLELWVLKSWCRSICPLGALLSIVGSLNRFFLPTVRKDQCRTVNGVNCRVCERVCPEGIDLAKIGKSFLPNSCTKCLECYEKCPAKAIEIALLR